MSVTFSPLNLPSLLRSSLLIAVAGGLDDAHTLFSLNAIYKQRFS